MYFSIDLGASTIDLVKWISDKEYEIVGSIDHNGDYDDLDLSGYIGQSGLDIDVSDIYVTGGRSKEWSKLRRFKHVGEIDAIGRGAAFLIDEDIRKDFVVASLGTGTCLVHYKQGESQHIGGTGVGGGTFLALSRELLGKSDVNDVLELFSHGDRSKVDLSVQDIVGGGIGIVSGDITASNLGRIARDVDFTPGDLAVGIVNLIGQTIATASCFAARSVFVKNLVLTGKLTRINEIVDVIKKTADVYGISVILPQDAAFSTAIGAGVHKSNL